jgi:hypothetical protein
VKGHRPPSGVRGVFIFRNSAMRVRRGAKRRLRTGAGIGVLQHQRLRVMGDCNSRSALARQECSKPPVGAREMEQMQQDKKLIECIVRACGMVAMKTSKKPASSISHRRTSRVRGDAKLAQRRELAARVCITGPRALTLWFGCDTRPQAPACLAAPWAMIEPYALKGACMVLRGRSGGNAALLPDREQPVHTIDALIARRTW